MLFNSDIFLFVFLPVTLAGFLLIDGTGQRKWVILWLILASLTFYGWWGPRYVVLLVFSVCLNFTIGSWLRRGHEAGATGRKALLAAGIAANLGFIGYFKYAGFILTNWNFLTGAGVDLGEIVLPLAISFFTFQQIAFLVDSYRRETGEYSFLPYCLYVTFFPQLIAGPIVYHREAMPQFMGSALGSKKVENFAIGFSIFVIGLCKKVLLADNLSVYVQPVYDAAAAGEAVNFMPAWTAALAYTFQLYFDFSGYSDMAIGLALLFGIRLPLNFDSPYKANNIIEFWRRWHMTLSRFLRDYLYIPMGGSRRGPVRRSANVMVTMLLGGLWHGASWTFVLWGGLHGLLLVANHLWRKVLSTWGLERVAATRPYGMAAHGLTFLCVVVGWVLFRADSFAAAGSILAAMAGLTDGGELNPAAAALIASAAFIAFAAPNTQQWMDFRPPLTDSPPRPYRGDAVVPAWRPGRVFGVGLASCGFAAVYMLRGTSEFLYFQF